MKIKEPRFFFICFLILVTAACTRSARMTFTPDFLPVIEMTSEGNSAEEDLGTIQAPQNLAVPTSTASAKTTNLPLTYSVAFLADGEILNVRSGPGVTYDIIDSLESNTHQIHTTGNKEQVDDIPWVEINLDTGTGWVSGAFLTEEKTSVEVCDDPQVGELLDAFTQAVRSRDGEALSNLVSPVHGLIIQHNLWNPAISLQAPDDIRSLFTSDIEVDWGIQDGSGEPIVGTFNEKILPRLEDVVLQNHSRHCNTLERGVSTGSTTGYVYWPYDYSAFNYIALFRPAPAEQELDWRTWVAGIEYVDGQPYIVVLVQFYWEI